MKKTDYLRCSCKICGGHIAFPEDGVGQVTECPHCGKKIKLYVDPAFAENPSKAQAPPNKNLRVIGLVGIACVVAAAGAAGFILFKGGKQVSGPATATNDPQMVSNAPPIPPQPRIVTLPETKLGPIRLEKKEGSSLVYAVGTLKNEANRQRFGVKIELDLFDDRNIKVGTATDYIAILEPQREWQFKALIAAPKTVTAKVAGVKEDE